MIVEGMAIAAVARTVYGINKSIEIDERALAKYAKAFEREEEAELLVRKKADYADKRIANVAKKKRAIVENTIPQFVDVYGQIQKIDLELQNTGVSEIAGKNYMQKIAVLDYVGVTYKQDYTDKELVCGLMTKGLGKVAEMDSERYLSAASSQMRASNVIYSQAQSISEIYDAIAGRADRIANVLMRMNALFVGSINETKKTIEKNGLDVRSYSKYDKSILMTCVNIAAAMSDLIDVPVVNPDGKLCEAALEMIGSGERFLEKMNQEISKGV